MKVREVYNKLGDYKEGTWIDDGVALINNEEIVEIESGARY